MEDSCVLVERGKKTVILVLAIALVNLCTDFAESPKGCTAYNILCIGFLEIKDHSHFFISPHLLYRSFIVQLENLTNLGVISSSMVHLCPAKCQ